MGGRRHCSARRRRAGRSTSSTRRPRRSAARSTGELVDETSPTVALEPVRRVEAGRGVADPLRGRRTRMSWASLRYFNVAGAADSVLAERGRSNSCRSCCVRPTGTSRWRSSVGTGRRRTARASVTMFTSRTSPTRTWRWRSRSAPGRAVRGVQRRARRRRERPADARCRASGDGRGRSGVASWTGGRATPHGSWPIRPRSPPRSAGGRNGISTTSSGARGRPTGPAYEADRRDAPVPDTRWRQVGSVSGLIRSSAARRRHVGHNGYVGCVGPADVRRGEGQGPRWVITPRGARLAKPSRSRLGPQVLTPPVGMPAVPDEVRSTPSPTCPRASRGAGPNRELTARGLDVGAQPLPLRSSEAGARPLSRRHGLRDMRSVDVRVLSRPGWLSPSAAAPRGAHRQIEAARPAGRRAP